MKILLLSLLLLGVTLATAQSPLSEAKVQELERSIEDLVPDKRAALKKQWKLESRDMVPLNFYLESWYIDTLMSMKIDLDFSTAGMNEAVRLGAEDYIALQDYLVEEIRELDVEVGEKLMASQKTWKTLAEQDLEARTTLYYNHQFELGSIYSNENMGLYLDAAQSRAQLLFDWYEDLHLAVKGVTPSTER